MMAIEQMKIDWQLLRQQRTLETIGSSGATSARNNSIRYSTP